MTYSDRRELCQKVFSGKTTDGRRMGVWVSWDEAGKKWRYRIEGHLIDRTGPLKNDWFLFGGPEQQEELLATSFAKG